MCECLCVCVYVCECVMCVCVCVCVVCSKADHLWSRKLQQASNIINNATNVHQVNDALLYCSIQRKGRDIYSAGYPPGAFFKGCEIFFEKIKGCEKNRQKFKGSENFDQSRI